MQITLTARLADEIRTWAQDEREHWPKDTAFQRELSALLHQLDVNMPTAKDVREMTDDDLD